MRWKCARIDRWSQRPNIAFDLSVLDIFGALCAGAALVPITGADLDPAGQGHPPPSSDDLGLGAEHPHVDDQERGRSPDEISRVAASTHVLRRAAAETPRRRPVRRAPGCRRAQYLRSDGSHCLVHAAPTHGGQLQGTRAKRPWRSGTPIPDMEIDLIGGDGADQAKSSSAGRSLQSGYWNDPSRHRAPVSHGSCETASRTRGYFTGDWAQRVGEARLFP